MVMVGKQDAWDKRNLTQLVVAKDGDMVGNIVEWDGIKVWDEFIQ